MVKMDILKYLDYEEAALLYCLQRHAVQYKVTDAALEAHKLIELAIARYELEQAQIKVASIEEALFLQE